MHILIYLTYTYDIYYAISIGGGKGHMNLKENGEGVHGRIWRQQREGRKVINH